MREVRERDLLAVVVGEREVRAGAGRSSTAPRAGLSTQAEVRDQGAVALQVGALQISEQAAALADHHQQAPAGMVVLRVGAQVLGELVDALGEQRDLDLGGPGVAIGPAVLADQLLLLFLGKPSSRLHRGRHGVEASTELCAPPRRQLHLGDQLLAACEALLAPQAPMNAIRRVCP